METTKKEYRCNNCLSEFKTSTNHYGQIYITPCCGIGIRATCMEIIPKEVEIPEPWDREALSEMLRVMKVA